ncbi:hypothetical protein [Hyphomicrobium sp.]|uniref:hypothetical protein n=1 Tax=Hyphomicrobium sp. TaxID=82 RepID=UPI0025B9BEEA|nr:hypothetical protein [Hyphomicrobium sp.]
MSRQTVEFDDLLLLKRVFYEDGVASAQEAELLIAMHRTCKVHHADWPDFFVEAITDYLILQEPPCGYLTAANAHWLIDQVSRDGRIESKTELELVRNVLDKARWAPASLSKFALEQVKHAVVTGAGPLRQAKTIPPGRISESEVDLLRRILYAFGGDGHVAVTRAEADVLFDIDEAVAGAPPNALWTDLFVKAIANVMMSASGYSVPSREEALRQDADIEEDDSQSSMLFSLLSMVHANLSSMQDAYHDQSVEERALARLEHQRIEIITNEEIADADPIWLVGRLGRGGRLSPSEQALVSYFNHESPRVHPAITEAVCRLGQAA